MNLGKRKMKVVALVVVFAVHCLVLSLAFQVMSNRNSQRIQAQLIEAFDNVDQNMAITQLIELRGRILEVQSLSFENLPQDILLDELEGITAPNDFSNPYLEDFTFIIHDTSNLEKICDELISQIDDQIHTIKYGQKDA